MGYIQKLRKSILIGDLRLSQDQRLQIGKHLIIHIISSGIDKFPWDTAYSIGHFCNRNTLISDFVRIIRDSLKRSHKPRLALLCKLYCVCSKLPGLLKIHKRRQMGSTALRDIQLNGTDLNTDGLS